MSDNTPRVWIGCLACYNGGDLVGLWYDAIEAGEVTSASLHERCGWNGVATDDGAFYRIGDPCPHEELWCMDHEYLPIEGECSPMEAQRIAEHIEQVEEYQRDAFVAWWLHDSYNVGDDGLASIEDFEERYCGEWDSFREYADERAAEDIACNRQSTPYSFDKRAAEATADFFERYFDWDSYARDMEQDHTTVPAPDFNVYVFRTD